MSTGRPTNLQSLPTLTEVIEVASAMRPQVAEDAASAPALDEEQLVQRVLVELQRHVDLMLEYRLREALTPVLARLSDSLIREVRHDFAATLRDVVARAVSQELTRYR